MTSIIIISVLISLATILTISLLLIFLLNKRNLKLKILLEKAIEKTSEEREAAILTSLKRISIIARSNKNIVATFQELDIIYRDFIININKLKKLVVRFNNEVKIIKVSSKKAMQIYKKIENEYTGLAFIEGKFNNLSHKVISQDEILRREFAFYQSRLREIINFYKEKRVLFDLIAPQIDNFNYSVKHIERQFENVIDKGDNANASILIQRYIQKIVKFAEIVSNGPALAMQIKAQIPNTFNNIYKLYLLKKNESKLPYNLDYINFQKTTKEISKQFNQAEKMFYALKIDKAVEKVKDVLKGFKTIENQINLEVRSRNIFINTYEKIISETKITLNKWMSINKQFKTLAGSGKKINPELIENYNDLKIVVKNLDHDAVNYRLAMKDKKMPYSVKIQRAIFLVESMKKCVNNINNFIDKIWEIDFENAMIKNKFSRAENALHEVIALVKKNNIILSYEEQINIDKVMKIKYKLSIIIKDNITTKDAQEVNNFSTKITNLYSIIASKVQMAFHIQNLIKEFAPQRAFNPKLNLGLKLVEFRYLEGNYVAGLNSAIDCIGENLGK